MRRRNANGFCASSIGKSKGHARNAKSGQEGGALCALKGAPFPLERISWQRRSGFVMPLDAGEDGRFFALGGKVDAQGLILYGDVEFPDDGPADAGGSFGDV